MKKMLALTLLLVLCGCATTRLTTYSGPMQRESEVSVLLLGGGFNEHMCHFATLLTSIDGKPISVGEWKKRYKSAALVPGEHLLVFDCGCDGLGNFQSRGTALYGSPAFYTFKNSVQEAHVNLLPGHRYQVRYHFVGALGWGTTTVRSIDITDITTGKVVFEKVANQN